MKNTGQLVSLSEQNLNDCSQQYGSQGCNGGNPEESFQYVIDNNGIDTEASYPFLMADGNPCNYNPANVGAQMTGFVQIPSGNETALQLAVAAVGPIACGFDASGDVFQFYSEGYYNNPQCSNVNLDHCMTLVGYGTDEQGRDYWLIKNQYGTDWGVLGYMFLPRNANNYCGIVTDSSYPTGVTA
jgi:cathepsin L